jgi:hypothetical protein
VKPVQSKANIGAAAALRASRRVVRWPWLLGAILLAPVAGAQEPAAQRPAASSAASAVASPALTYASTFAAYRPWSAGETPGWRAANDRVAAVGGWRAYLRQVQEGSPR